MKAICRPQETITPSVKLQSYWWARLNRDLFAGKLPHPAGFLIHASAVPDTWAWYDADDMPGVGKFSFWSYPVTRGQFVATMIHEMIHQLQHLRGRPMVHGRFFRVMCRKYGRRAHLPVT